MTIGINCDLDGVLADFERGFHIFYGVHPHDIPEPEMWSKILSNPDHWVNLPAMPGAIRLWAKIAPYNARIITGCPSTGYQHAAEGKRAWCLRELGPQVEVITTYSRYKTKHIKSPGDILIDDMEKNCKRWEEAGGVAILHTSADETIAQLEKLGL